MDDSGLMRRGQRRRDLRGETEQFTHRHWRLNHALSQGFALDEFRGDELMRIYLADLVNGQDVGMVQRGSGASFLLKSPHALSIASEESRQHFQRHLTKQMLVFSQVNLSHASGPKLFENLVAADCSAHERLSLFIRKYVGHYFKRRQLDEIIRSFMRRKQSFELAAQSRITGACLVKELWPLNRSPLESRV